MNIYHRYFVQYMLKHGVSTVNDALNYCNLVSQGTINNSTLFKTLVIQVNREISKQFYKIAFTVCEVTNKNLVVWLNTKDDDISRSQITFSAIELEYFNAILQEIISSNDHRITFIVCINITSTLTAQFSRDSGQKVLYKWLRGGYYIKQGDYIHLGARTVLEFTSYLRSQCPDSICNLCSELVFTGEKCVHCDKLLHSYCLSTYLNNQSNCPYCKNEWIFDSEEQNGFATDSYTEMDTINYNNTMVTDNTDGSQRNKDREKHARDIEEAGPSRKRHR